MPKDLIPKGYARTRDGQVHYRRLGAGSATFLLIHWLPLSSRMYAALMPLLAARGFDVLAVDLLGYGRSDPRPTNWSMTAWADNVEEVLTELGCDTVVALGGHSGACVVAELAVRHRQRVTRVILDGCPLPTPELRATFRSMKTAQRPTPQPDRSHESLVFNTVRTTYEHYLPGFTVTAENLERLWPAMIDYLETDFVSSAPISADYDLAATLTQITRPLTLLSAETDTLFPTFGVARQLVPNARARLFTGDHPLHDISRTMEYCEAILD